MRQKLIGLDISSNCTSRDAGADLEFSVTSVYSFFHTTSTLVPKRQNDLPAEHFKRSPSDMKDSYFRLGKRKIGLCQNNDAWNQNLT